MKKVPQPTIQHLLQCFTWLSGIASHSQFTRNKVSPAFLAFIGKDDEGQIKPVIREDSLFLLSFFFPLVPLAVGGDSSFQDN